ncbi:hypothetical protein BDQ17DRAFT_757571 [Cyathus striatus]|nr:hypothetical protein BDQ17DRAFT_757571 [Cyathus striatus]
MGRVLIRIQTPHLCSSLPYVISRGVTGGRFCCRPHAFHASFIEHWNDTGPGLIPETRKIYPLLFYDPDEGSSPQLHLSPASYCSILCALYLPPFLNLVLSCHSFYINLLTPPLRRPELKAARLSNTSTTKSKTTKPLFTLSLSNTKTRLRLRKCLRSSCTRETIARSPFSLELTSAQRST